MFHQSNALFPTLTAKRDLFPLLWHDQVLQYDNWGTLRRGKSLLRRSSKRRRVSSRGRILKAKMRMMMKSRRKSNTMVTRVTIAMKCGPMQLQHAVGPQRSMLRDPVPSLNLGVMPLTSIVSNRFGLLPPMMNQFEPALHCPPLLASMPLVSTPFSAVVPQSIWELTRQPMFCRTIGSEVLYHQQLTVIHHFKLWLMIPTPAQLSQVTQLSVALILICHLALECITNLLPNLLVPACIHLGIYPHLGQQPSGTILDGQTMTAYTSTLQHIIAVSTLKVNSFLEVRPIRGIQDILRPPGCNNLLIGTVSIRTLHVPAWIND